MKKEQESIFYARGREWKVSLDPFYYDDVLHLNCWCVRPTTDNNFESELSFHFLNKEDALAFQELLIKSK
jgi:hypothetical protein